MNRIGKRCLAVMTLLIASGGAYAASDGANDATAITTAKVPLIQAVTVAEQHANGKASRAKFEKSKKHGPVYEVEVVSGAKVFDVKVDADKGSVISAVEDKSDPDGDKDGDQDD